MARIKLKDLINEFSSREISLREEVPNIGDVKKMKACRWEINEPGIKIFFDVTGVLRQSKMGYPFGATIAVVSMLNHRVLHTVNHVGFILSDGTIIHATNSKGVVRESGEEIQKNPQDYVCVNVGGDENLLVQKFEKLKPTLYKDTDAYDWKGIARQVPILGKLLARLVWFRENKPYRFFCSELVANLLVRCGVVDYNELVGIHEKLSGLDKYDEIDPTKLFNLIKSKAKLCSISCEK